MISIDKKLYEFGSDKFNIIFFIINITISIIINIINIIFGLNIIVKSKTIKSSFADKLNTFKI